MSGWDDLQQASLAGLEFEIVSSNDEGGSVLDKQQFPGRNGQSIDDRAALPEQFDLVVDFIEGEYPQTLDNMLSILRAGGIQEFVHPYHGSVKVGIERWRLVHDPEDGTDCARLSLTLPVHTDAPAAALTNTVPAMANAARSACDDVTAAAAAYELLTDDATQKQACSDAMTLSTSASATADSLELDGDITTAVQIQAMVNSVVTRADSIGATIADYDSPERYALGRALTAMMFALETLGGAFIAAKPPIIEEPVPCDVPLLVYAHERYGDSSRALELLALNSILDPLEMPSGRLLRRYAR
jgi:prophage DNA circulation protein